MSVEPPPPSLRNYSRVNASERHTRKPVTRHKLNITCSRLRQQAELARSHGSVFSVIPGDSSVPRNIYVSFSSPRISSVIFTQETDWVAFAGRMGPSAILTAENSHPSVGRLLGAAEDGRSGSTARPRRICLSRATTVPARTTSSARCPGVLWRGEMRY